MGIITTTNKQYVTYLSKQKYERSDFDPSLIETDLSHFLDSKPKCAWWGSPVDATFGWKDYCLSDYGTEDFDFEHHSIYWHLKEGSKIFQIDMDDVKLEESNELLKYIYFTDNSYPVCEKHFPITETIEILNSYEMRPRLNFSRILSDGIVAVELMDACIGHMFMNQLETMFNSWDCESIVILDSSKIIFERGEKYSMVKKVWGVKESDVKEDKCLKFD